MKLVPILEENVDFIRLDLTRHYLQIDCDFTCFIVLNPSGNIPTGGTDICALHVGAWQVDAWSFLTDKFTKGVAGFSACLVWDKTLINSIYKAPQVAESDIDTANSISSLKGQPVNITGFSMAEGESLPVKSLNDSFVNVQPYKNKFDDGVKFFPVTVQYDVFNLGDSFDVDKLSQLYDIREVDGKYRVSAPFLACYSKLQYSASSNRGDFKAGVVSANASTMYIGVCGLCYVDVTLSDGLISELICHYDSFVYEFAHQTPWHHVQDFDSYSVIVGV